MAEAESQRREAQRASLEGAPLRSRPANENDPATSMMLARFRRKPANTPYYVAFGVSLAWIAGWFFIFSQPLSSGAGGLPEVMKAIALLVLPLGVFAIAADFLRRTAQLRLMSEVLMHTAMRLVRPQDMAAEGLSTIAQAVRAEVETLTGSVEHAVQRASVLEEIVHKEVASIERAFGSNEERIRTLVSGIENQRTALHQAALVINNDAGSVLNRLEGNTQNLDRLIITAQDTLTRLEESLREATHGLGRTIDDMAGRAGAAGQEISSQITQMERLSSHVTNELRDFSRNLSSHIDQLSQVTTTINSESAHFNRNIQGLESSVVQAIRQSADQLGTINAEAIQMIERIGQETSEQIERSRVVVTQTLQNVTGDLVEQTAAGLTNQLQLTTSAINDLLVTTSATVTSHLKETSDIVNRQMQESGLALATNIESTGGIVTDKLISASEIFVENVGKTRDDLFHLLEHSSKEMTTSLAETTNQLYTRLDTTSAGITSQIEDIATRITARIDHTTDNATGKFAVITDTLTVRLDESSRMLSELLDKTTTELSALFTANTKMMTDQLDKTSTTVTTTFAETAVRVTTQVNEVNSLMADRLETASTNMFGKIDATVRDLGQRFDVATNLLENVTGEMSGKFAKVLDTASTQIISGLGRASSAFSEGLGQTTMQITGRLEQDSGLMVDRIDRATRELETVSTTTGDRLDEAHRKFTKHVETASTYLTDQLSSVAQAMDDRLESISMNLTGKLEVTGSKLTERLDDVSTLVDRSVDKFNNEMERVLQSRRDVLDQLIGDASKRANEIDAVMSSYMTLIENSLAASETRAKEISRIVSEQSALATANLEEEIRKLETTSGGQITQAARVLREQHERAMAAMNEMLSATASDFQQTAQDMRITAQQVVKEIDGARNELKRAIFDLPEETRSNADAMRRVVSDQITALGALADAVKRQKGTLDVSGPLAPQRGQRDYPPGKSEGTPVSAPQSGPVGALERTTERARNGDPTADIRDRIMAELTRTSAKIAQPVKGQVPAVAPTGREVEGMAEKLHLAARDIVETVEDGLPRDAERSFRDGDRAVYSRRLLEGRGKRNYRQIAARYAAERLLRGRIDTYIKLFERLLDSMSAAPKGESMVKACLESEAGHIYMMLTDVTGRRPTQ